MDRRGFYDYEEVGYNDMYARPPAFDRHHYDMYSVRGYGSGASSTMEWGAAPRGGVHPWASRPFHRYGVRSGPTAAQTVRLMGELDDIEERIRTLRRHGAYGAYGVVARGVPNQGGAAGMRPSGIEKKRVEEEIDMLEGARQRIMRELNRRNDIVRRGGLDAADDVAALRMGGPLPNADSGIRAMSATHGALPRGADGSIEAMARALEAKAAAIELKAKLAAKSKKTGKKRSKKGSDQDSAAQKPFIDRDLEDALRHSLRDERNLDERVRYLTDAAKAMLWGEDGLWDANPWARGRRSPWLRGVHPGAYYSAGPHPGQRPRYFYDPYNMTHARPEMRPPPPPPPQAPPYMYDDAYERDLSYGMERYEDDDADVKDEPAASESGVDDLSRKLDALNEKLAMLETRAGLSIDAPEAEPKRRLRRQRTSGLSYDPTL